MTASLTVGSVALCLVLLVSGRLKLLRTITAFTIAHRIILAAAAIDDVLIESLVARRIVFVAVELTQSCRGRQGTTTSTGCSTG